MDSVVKWCVVAGADEGDREGDEAGGQRGAAQVQAAKQQAWRHLNAHGGQVQCFSCYSTSGTLKEATLCNLS